MVTERQRLVGMKPTAAVGVGSPAGEHQGAPARDQGGQEAGLAGWTEHHLPLFGRPVYQGEGPREANTCLLIGLRHLECRALKSHLEAGGKEQVKHLLGLAYPVTREKGSAPRREPGVQNGVATLQHLSLRWKGVAGLAEGCLHDQRVAFHGLDRLCRRVGHNLEVAGI